MLLKELAQEPLDVIGGARFPFFAVCLTHWGQNSVLKVQAAANLDLLG